MKPEYPKEIISYPHYKRNMNVDDLLTRYPNLLVARCIEGRLEDFLMTTQAGNTELSSKVFKSSLANLSMNLGGGLFDIKSNSHLRFLPTIKEASEIWDGNIVPESLYKSEDNYIFFEACFGLCFLVCNIHNRTFPFYKHFNSQEERDKYEADTLTAISKENINYDAHFVGEFKTSKQNVLVKPRIKVHHFPTKVNYWHMTLDTYRPTDIDFVHPYDKQSSSDKSMFKALKQDLLQCYRIDSRPEYTINSCFYTL